MSSSFTITETTTFTLTHARHMAAKVATDLKRLQRLYGSPSDQAIANYEAEVIELLKAGYLGTLTVGYKRDGDWIEPTLRYSARNLMGGSAGDDDPGRIRPGANIEGAEFYNCLTYSSAWDELRAAEKDAFKRRMPFYRTGGRVDQKGEHLRQPQFMFVEPDQPGEPLSRLEIRIRDPPLEQLVEIRFPAHRQLLTLARSRARPPAE